MYADLKNDALSLLRGRYIKSFTVASTKYCTFFLFISVIFFSSYLLFFDTSFLENIGVFKNKYILAIVCFCFVVINISLFLLHIASALYSAGYFSFEKTKKIDLFIILKACIMYFLLFVRKFISFVFFMTPCILTAFLFLYMSSYGVYFKISVVSSFCIFLLFVSGLYSYLVYKQKFVLVPYFFINADSHGITESFRYASECSDGKCAKMFFLKICNLPKKLLCVFIFPAIYLLPLCKTSEYCFLLEKEKPYVKRKSHTEKTVVFYFEPAKEN